MNIGEVWSTSQPKAKTIRIAHDGPHIVLRLPNTPSTGVWCLSPWNMIDEEKISTRHLDPDYIHGSRSPMSWLISRSATRSQPYRQHSKQRRSDPVVNRYLTIPHTVHFHIHNAAFANAKWASKKSIRICNSCSRRLEHHYQSTSQKWIDATNICSKEFAEIPSTLQCAWISELEERCLNWKTEMTIPANFQPQ